MSGKEQSLEAAEPPVSVPKVYCWCNQGAGTEFQVWVAMAEDGEVLKSHLCSHERYAEHDLHIFGRDLFAAKFGGFGDGEFYELVWEVAPKEVYERNQALARAALNTGGSAASQNSSFSPSASRKGE